MDRRRLVAVAKVTLAVVAWGASFIATKVALREVSPITVVWLRFAIGVVVLGAVVAVRRQGRRVARRDLAEFALLGFLAITFHQWLQSNGLVTARATTTAWIVATIPVFMAILGWTVLKERLRPDQVLGIALATAGVLVVVSDGDLPAVLRGSFGVPGDALILASAVNWAVVSALSKRWLARHEAALMTFHLVAFGWLFSTAALLAGPGLGELGRLTASGWAGVVFLGVACSGLAYVFWYDALKALPASEMGAFLYLEPLVASGVAAVILGEPLTVAVIAGGTVILGGVWLVNRPVRSSGKGP
ncbi:MAG TPA: DMT family transporter [Candidatus Krumholzibacteria bacterium]|nr:DMT family transporter [Candidatus Krumholzibacteria bacterium]HPD71898.1 DMT family transporter [Candidatus Krumholzibacteria bacterium]HRY41169.1 DMT family transporter [Candidatus Krumholzibacteria bacterium]